jgi:hypothetical protein
MTHARGWAAPHNHTLKLECLCRDGSAQLHNRQGLSHTGIQSHEIAAHFRSRSAHREATVNVECAANDGCSVRCTTEQCRGPAYLHALPRLVFWPAYDSVEQIARHAYPHQH